MFPVDNPFLAYIGARCIYANNTGCVLELDLNPHLTNSWGNGHGGVLMTLMDVSMSWAARFYTEQNMGAMTINFNATFIKAAKQKLIVKACVIKTTSTLAFCESKIFEQDELVATATATFKYAKKLA